MKKAFIIAMIILYLSLGSLMLYYTSNSLDIFVKSAVKICGIFFIGLSFYMMYKYRKLVQ